MTDLTSWFSANWHVIAAAVAVVAPSTAAVVAVVNSWREGRSLEISILPDKFHHYWETKRFALRCDSQTQPNTQIRSKIGRSL